MTQQKGQANKKLEIGQAATMLKNELATYEKVRKELEKTPDIDAQALSDMLEGETYLEEALEAVADEIAEREALIKALALRKKDIEARKSRMENSVNTLRALIMQAMEIAKKDRINCAEATISIMKVPPNIKIEDESAIPSKYWKQGKPTLDRVSLKEDLKNNISITGCCLGEEKKSLSIRRD